MGPDPVTDAVTRPQGIVRRHLRLSRDRVHGASFGSGQPSTPWDVVLYVDAGASDEQLAALADIFLGRASERSPGYTALP